MVEIKSSKWGNFQIDGGTTLIIVAEHVTGTGFRVSPSVLENCVEGKLNKAFLHFLPNFYYTYLMIFKSGAVEL